MPCLWLRVFTGQQLLASHEVASEGSGQPGGASEDWFVLIFEHWLSALISLEKLLSQIGEVGDGAGAKFSAQKSAGRDVQAVGA